MMQDCTHLKKFNISYWNFKNPNIFISDYNLKMSTSIQFTSPLIVKISFISSACSYIVPFLFL